MKTKDVKTVLAILIAAVMLCTVAVPCYAANDDVIEVTFAHIFEPGHTLYEMVEGFAARVEEESGGHIKVNVVPAGALGGMDSNLEALDMGTIDLCLAGESYTSTYYAPLAVSTAPYAFQSWDHFRNYLNSDFFAQLKQEYYETTGNKIIGSYTSGFRSITANKEIRTPDDLKGVKIRVPDAPAFTAMPIACGASPTPMALSEVYLALQQGVVDAQENPLETSFNQKFYEVCKYICITEHMMEPAHIVASGLFWDKLSAEDQAMIEKIAVEVSAEATDKAQQSADGFAEQFAELGCTIITDVDKEAFAELCLAFNTSPDRAWSAEQWEQLQALK